MAGALRLSGASGRSYFLTRNAGFFNVQYR